MDQKKGGRNYTRLMLDIDRLETVPKCALTRCRLCSSLTSESEDDYKPSKQKTSNRAGT